MIYQTLSQSCIADELMGDDYANWSYAGAMAMACYYMDLYEGKSKELDLAEIRGEWSEYESREDFLNDFRDPDLTIEEVEHLIIMESDNFIIVCQG